MMSHIQSAYACWLKYLVFKSEERSDSHEFNNTIDSKWLKNTWIHKLENPS